MKVESKIARVLLTIFCLEWALLAIAPTYRQDWALENVLVLVGLWGIVSWHAVSPFSVRACLYLFIFGSLHEIGSHYTYSEVPYDRWIEWIFGESLLGGFDWSRNHYDRVVHFMFGFLLFQPLREIGQALFARRGPIALLIPMTVLWALSSVYELVEWGAAEAFGGDLGAAYLGTQGDVWDAQKDMFLAHLGAAIAYAHAAAHYLPRSLNLKVLCDKTTKAQPRAHF